MQVELRMETVRCGGCGRVGGQGEVEVEVEVVEEALEVESDDSADEYSDDTTESL